MLKHILNQELFHFLILIIIAWRFLLNFLEELNLGDSRLRLRFLVIIGYGIAVFLAWSPLLLIRICASLAIVTKFMIITLYFLFHLIHFIQIIKKTKQDIQQWNKYLSTRKYTQLSETAFLKSYPSPTPKLNNLVYIFPFYIVSSIIYLVPSFFLIVVLFTFMIFPF